MNISFEFFPPNSEEGIDKLLTVAERLNVAKPEYFSVTYGAGGSTQEKTLATVRALRSQGYPVAPHVSCIGTTKAHIKSLLDAYLALGIHRIVALRGDLPSGMVQGGDFRYASDLVSFVRGSYGNRFHIEVASYPEVHPASLDAASDLRALQTKFQSGADSAITQFFYNADAYHDHVEQARKLGITQPIIPGVMPIHNFSAIQRFASSCGAELPRWLVKRIQCEGDNAEAIREIGLATVTRLCQQLTALGAPGLHFYTMNQSSLSLEILRRLKLV